MTTGMLVESPVRGNSHAGLYVPRMVMLKMLVGGGVCPAPGAFSG